MGKQKIHIVTMLLGLLIAVAVVCSNVFQPEYKTQVKIENKAGKKSDEKQVTVISAPTLSLPSTFLVNLNLETYCLFEISSGDRRDESFHSDWSSVHPQRYLLTLFRVIISPNAP